MFEPTIPDNNLKPQLEKIMFIAKELEKNTKEIRMKFSFNLPANVEELNSIENKLGIILPVGYKEFLQFSNGAVLCGNTARFYDINQVIGYNQLENNEEYIIIASIIGDGEVLQFSKKTGKFVFFFDGEENMYDDFYDAFDEIISLVKTKAEDYIDL